VNIQHNGSPFAAGVRTDKFKAYRRNVRAFIHRHEASPAVKTAYTLAEDLLKWTPERDWRAHGVLRDRLQVLLGFGVTAKDVVCRVIEFALYEQANPFRSARVMQMQLARSIVKLAPLNKYRPAGHPMLLLATLVIENGLWGFAAGAVARMESDWNRKAAVKKSISDYGPE
jgi:hypothetical protein